MHQPHAFAATTRRGLQHHGIANSRSHLLGFLERLHPARCAGHERHARLLHGLPRARLRSHRIHRSGRWPYEFHSGIATGLRELRVLGKKTVTGMDGVGPRPPRDIENFPDIEIRFGGRSGPKGIGLVSLAHMQRGAVYVRVNHYGCNPHLVARAQHAHRNLTPVGDQNFLEHRHGQAKRFGEPQILQ